MQLSIRSAMLNLLRSAAEIHQAATIAATATVAGAVYVTWIKPVKFNWAIDATLKAGSKPEIGHFINCVDRSKTIAKIEGLLHSCDGLFGVILGPCGTGKTYATRVACNRDPSFILYCEIYEPRMTAQELARAAGFVEEGFFNFIFGRIIKRPAYHLAENKVEALSQVLDIVGKRAECMKKTKNLKSPPCFDIDGADLVAKYDAKLFETIVDRVTINNKKSELYDSYQFNVVFLLLIVLTYGIVYNLAVPC